MSPQTSEPLEPQDRGPDTPGRALTELCTLLLPVVRCLRTQTEQAIELADAMQSSDVLPLRLRIMTAIEEAADTAVAPKGTPSHPPFNQSISEAAKILREKQSLLDPPEPEPMLEYLLTLERWLPLTAQTGPDTHDGVT